MKYIVKIVKLIIILWQTFIFSMEKEEVNPTGIFILRVREDKKNLFFPVRPGLIVRSEKHFFNKYFFDQSAYEGTNNVGKIFTNIFPTFNVYPLNNNFFHGNSGSLSLSIFTLQGNKNISYNSNHKYQLQKIIFATGSVGGKGKIENIKAVGGLFEKLISIKYFLDQYKELQDNAHFIGSKENEYVIEHWKKCFDFSENFKHRFIYISSTNELEKIVSEINVIKTDSEETTVKMDNSEFHDFEKKMESEESNNKRRLFLLRFFDQLIDAMTNIENDKEYKDCIRLFFEYADSHEYLLYYNKDEILQEEIHWWNKIKNYFSGESKKIKIIDEKYLEVLSNFFKITFSRGASAKLLKYLVLKCIDLIIKNDGIGLESLKKALDCIDQNYRLEINEILEAEISLLLDKNRKNILLKILTELKLKEIIIQEHIAANYFFEIVKNKTKSRKEYHVIFKKLFNKIINNRDDYYYKELKILLMNFPHYYGEMSFHGADTLKEFSLEWLTLVINHTNKKDDLFNEMIKIIQTDSIFYAQVCYEILYNSDEHKWKKHTIEALLIKENHIVINEIFFRHKRWHAEIIEILLNEYIIKEKIIDKKVLQGAAVLFLYLPIEKQKDSIEKINIDFFNILAEFAFQLWIKKNSLYTLSSEETSVVSGWTYKISDLYIDEEIIILLLYQHIYYSQKNYKTIVDSTIIELIKKLLNLRNI